MNPNLFTSRIYGYNTNNVNYQKQMKQEEMQNVVDKVLYEMNTKPHSQNSYYTTPDENIYTLPKKPDYSKIQSNSLPKKIQKTNNILSSKEEVKNSQPPLQFTPEFYNILKDMISKEFDRREINKKNDNYKQVLRKLQFYERKINLLENEIVTLKKF